MHLCYRMDSSIRYTDTRRFNRFEFHLENSFWTKTCRLIPVSPLTQNRTSFLKIESMKPIISIFPSFQVLVSPVLAGLAVAIGVPILLFYVYGVVPVSLCRAGCAVSTTRDGFKFDFDDEDNSSRNHDAASVDAISRIGATSIGEVSLSVVSGSHVGALSHNNTFSLAQSNANRESMTALSGSITGYVASKCEPKSHNNDIMIMKSKCYYHNHLNFLRNKMEVQADVSASETASAVTCVSEKSNNTQNDNASTRALAGSLFKQVMQKNVIVFQFL